MLKKVIIIVFFLFSNYSFSQFHHYYFANSKGSIAGIKYQDKYYSSSSSGLKKFINETEMPDELKNNLNEQARRIATKNIVSGILVYGGFALGGGIMFNEVVNKKDGENPESATLFKGLGIAVLGGVFNFIISPKRKDYFNFINTFNENQNGDKLKVSLKIDYSKQLNYGISMSF
ncbi:hypothetical protein [Flavobacterium sp. UMI-01]|uniref:hypothetical protein n=1 Tax=Flavobacterium sp. UMI-01 TaxID=1441053 RepID=UPI001C7CB3FC|nr:hypothetical protein [Flavobacterium sp. UMI-01]GIZ08851.1 hypothetical protein FUMI01_15780 [Flavobacterium sp. UMI-01]